MGKTQSIKIRRGVGLYKQSNKNGLASPKWYHRIFLPIGDKKVHIRSTGTTDLAEAIKRTESSYVDLLLLQRGIDPQSLGRANPNNQQTLFGRVADEYVDMLERDAGEDQKKRWDVRNAKQLLYGANGLARFFSEDDVDSITKDRIKEYLPFQVQHSRRGHLRPGTQKKALILLQQVLKFACEKGLLSKVPALPKIKEKDQPRAWFDRKEYLALISKARELAAEAQRKGDKAEADLWYEMADFIAFMVNTFLRSSEWASLQHQHIEEVGERPRYLRLSVIKGKIRMRVSASLPEAASIYDRIRERTGSDPDTHLFLHSCANRTTARDKMRDRFEVLLKATNLKQNALGQTRVIHSLRHSALMFRLLAKVDTHLLASNAGTSVAQLERFYCSHFQADMKLDELHKGIITLDLRKGSPGRALPAPSTTSM